MARKNGAVVEAVTRAEDMREAMVTIGRIIADTEVTPKGKLQRITGVLSLYEIKVEPAKPAVTLNESMQRMDLLRQELEGL